MCVQKHIWQQGEGEVAAWGEAERLWQCPWYKNVGKMQKRTKAARNTRFPTRDDGAWLSHTDIMCSCQRSSYFSLLELPPPPSLVGLSCIDNVRLRRDLLIPATANKGPSNILANLCRNCRSSPSIQPSFLYREQKPLLE